jgi:hypothetical protein
LICFVPVIDLNRRAARGRVNEEEVTSARDNANAQRQADTGTAFRLRHREREPYGRAGRPPLRRRCDVTSALGEHVSTGRYVVRFRADWLPALKTCLDIAEDWYEVERCFHPHVADDQVDDGRPVVYAFGYMLVEASRGEKRDRLGIFAPRITWDNGAAFPAPLHEISDDMLAVWEEYAVALGDSAVATSRLRDLLWVRRFGDPPVEHARRAADAYLELATAWKGMRLVDCISRALEIGVEINDAERRAAAVQRAVTGIDSELKIDEWRPGITLRLLESLVSLRPDDHPPELGQLLAAGDDRYAADPFIAQSISELQAALARPDERRDLVRQQVERWRLEAARATGILRYAHLQHALGLARTHGLGDLVNAVLGEIQQLSVDDLDLKPISTEISIPSDELEAEVNRIAEDAASWQDAFALFGIDGPPSGKVEANETLVDELAEQHPLTVLIPRQVLGAHSSLVFDAREPDEHHRVELAQQEATRIRLWALFATDKLGRIVQRFGAPMRDDLAGFFTTDLIDAAVATRLADGVLRHLEGDDEGALHVLIPQVEAAIRGIAARASMPVIKNPQGDRPGGVIPLGGILASLKGRIDESWRRYLLNALADPLGVNLRNNVAHGLHGPVSAADVVVAIHIACHLRLLGSATQNEEPRRSS